MIADNVVVCPNSKLTDHQKEWFADRMDESRNGRVIVSTHLVRKYKKITNQPDLENFAVRTILIDYCYNKFGGAIVYVSPHKKMS